MKILSAYFPPRAALISLVSLGILATTLPAIAKPKPDKPNQNPQPVIEAVERETVGVTHGEYWENLLEDVTEDYAGEVAPDLVDQLEGDISFRDRLLDLFLGQDGDRQAIEDIVLDILLGQDYNEHGTEGGYHTEIIRYDYEIDRSCLPPGQLQRLDSGKPVPPGILKKCGSIITVDD